MTCPYASTCLASRLPTDNICATCTIRGILEKRDASSDATCAEPGVTAHVVDNIHIGTVFVRCSCGPDYPVDEDGCCQMCGEDAFRGAFEASARGLAEYQTESAKIHNDKADEVTP